MTYLAWGAGIFAAYLYVRLLLLYLKYRRDEREAEQQDMRARTKYRLADIPDRKQSEAQAKRYTEHSLKKWEQWP